MQPLIMETAAAVINKQKNFSMMELMLNTNDLAELVFSLEHLNELKISPKDDKLKFDMELQDGLLHYPEPLLDSLKQAWSKRKLEELIQEVAIEKLTDEQKQALSNSAIAEIIPELIQEDDEYEEVDEDDLIVDISKLNANQAAFSKIITSIFGKKNVRILDLKDSKEYAFVIAKETIDLKPTEISTMLVALTKLKFKNFSICTDYAEDDEEGEVATGVRIIISIGK